MGIWSQSLNELLDEMANPVRTTHVTYNTAYDTAWVARLGGVDTSLSYPALDWICEHQLPDGSWGGERPMYYHDRVISTLAAMTALARGRRARDKVQLERGRQALEVLNSRATKGLPSDAAGATVGFEMIVPTLLAEAEAMDVIQITGEHILGRLARQRAAKLAMLNGRTINRFITSAFSSEMAGPDNQQMLDVANLQEPNGSIAHSPSATAYFALHVRAGDPLALEYLRAITMEGGVPSTAPFDVFERVWVMWNVALIDAHEAATLARCQPHIDFLKSIWRPGKGASYASDHILPDGDDTALTYDVLAAFGHSLDVEAILSYEEDDHFRCYSLETTPSTSANVHVLGALRRAGFEPDHPVIQKILKFLRRSQMANALWIDKWHASPYYTAAHAVIACVGYADDLAQAEIDWILKTQNADGSWGHYQMPTAEETAYSLQALSVWQRNNGKVPAEALKQGAAWLADHSEPPYPAFWIGKCLYCPELVVRSTILSALLVAT